MVTTLYLSLQSGIRHNMHLCCFWASWELETVVMTPIALFPGLASMFFILQFVYDCQLTLQNREGLGTTLMTVE